MRLAVIVVGAVAVAAVVLVSVASDAAGLFHAAWWAPALLLLVPAVMLVLWLRER